MIINVDSDGVVYDLVAITQMLALKEYGAELPKPTSWGFDNWPISFNQIRGLWTQQGVFNHGPEVAGAIEGVKRLVDQGHQVRIVTDKHGLPDQSQAMRETIEFYEWQGLLGDVDMVFSHGKDYPADVIIDDKPDLSWAQDGKINLLFAQPWNRSTPPDLRIVRVSGWVAVQTAIRILT